MKKLILLLAMGLLTACVSNPKLPTEYPAVLEKFPGQFNAKQHVADSADPYYGTHRRESNEAREARWSEPYSSRKPLHEVEIKDIDGRITVLEDLETGERFRVLGRWGGKGDRFRFTR